MRRIRKKLQNNEVCIGSWIQIPSADIAEMMARQGFDWVAADIEHTETTNAQTIELFRGLGQNTAPMARVRSNDTLAIRQTLDMGASGVIVPLIETAEEAAKAVAAAKYPPEGVRGFAFCRANNWGEDFDEYVARINDEVAVIVMIESKKAVENIDEILAVPGVDGVFIGPYDMSGSYGIPGQTGDPLVTGACDQVVAACKKAGTAAGIHIVTPTCESVSSYLEKGFTFIALGIDTYFLATGMKAALKMAGEFSK